jgi:hypothetical protein
MLCRIPDPLQRLPIPTRSQKELLPKFFCSFSFSGLKPTANSDLFAFIAETAFNLWMASQRHACSSV